MCAGAIILYRVEKIIYLAPDIRHGALGSHINIFDTPHPIHQPKIEYIEGIDQAGQMLKDFFKLRRKKNEKRRADFGADDLHANNKAIENRKPN
jgi:tRNA(adenine34) deaminase